jgi:NAD(P)-dependent dehydrogenase (short-subunit alcohol dehydrogenase family)
MLPLMPPGSPAPVPAARSLAGRVVLVTGATGGLGRSCALACAQAGATVVLLGRRVRALESLYDEIEKGGAPTPAIYPMNLDGAVENDYADLAAALERDCGRLDGIVHAAAHLATLQPFDQQPAREWQTCLKVNVTAPFLVSQACMPLLRAAPDSAIVFVLDDPARVRKAFWGGYGVAKHALMGLVSMVHEETTSLPVRVHGLLPGPMRTGLRRTAYFGEDTRIHPLPDAAGAAAAWLLGPEALPWRGRVLDLRAESASGIAHDMGNGATP